FRQFLQEARALPGVYSVTLSRSLPLSTNSGKTELTIEGNAPVSAGAGPAVGYEVVEANYFQTLGIPLLEGRSFDGQEPIGAQKTAIINETAARLFWPNQNPL